MKKDTKIDKENNHLDIEELHRILDNINEWIRNCDNKASIILGIVGVICSLFFKIEHLNVISNFVKSRNYDNLEKSILCSLLLISFLMLFYGICLLISVLLGKTANTDAKHKWSKGSSLLHFADIAKHAKVNDYTKKLYTYSEKDLKEDVIMQIYICSKICDKKFADYKKGVIFTFIGIFFTIFMMSFIYVVTSF